MGVLEGIRRRKEELNRTVSLLGPVYELRIKEKRVYDLLLNNETRPSSILPMTAITIRGTHPGTS